MKRRILILLLVFALMIPVLAACGDKDGKDDADAGETSEEQTTPEATDPPTEAPTEDPGPKIKREEIQLFEEEGHEAVSANGAGISLAMYFQTDMTLISMTFSCPSWSDDLGQMTLDIYKWDTDYETTVAGTPVFTEVDEFTDYPDNANVEVEFPENLLGPGEYLYTFRDGRDGVGMWKSTENVEGIQSYFKGNPVNGVYKTWIFGWYYVE